MYKESKFMTRFCACEFILHGQAFVPGVSRFVYLPQPLFLTPGHAQPCFDPKWGPLRRLPDTRSRERLDQPSTGVSDSDGIDEGNPVGSDEGNPVGISLGLSVGSNEGNPLGLSLGLSVGSDEGNSVGSDEGNPVGISLGSDEGNSVGISLGALLGKFVGELVFRQYLSFLQARREFFSSLQRFLQHFLLHFLPRSNFFLPCKSLHFFLQSLLLSIPEILSHKRWHASH